MGEFSPFHWLVVLAIVVLLFGGKKIPEVMRGLGEGIRSFKEGMHGAGQLTSDRVVRAFDASVSSVRANFDSGDRGKEVATPKFSRQKFRHSGQPTRLPFFFSPSPSLFLSNQVRLEMCKAWPAANPLR